MNNAMKARILRQKSTDELVILMKNKRAALRTFRFNISGSKTKNVREGRNARRSLAQSLTILKERNAKQ